MDAISEFKFKNIVPKYENVFNHLEIIVIYIH